MSSHEIGKAVERAAFEGEVRNSVWDMLHVSYVTVEKIVVKSSRQLGKRVWS